MTIEESLEKSLAAAPWLHSADGAAVASARRLARLLDALFDSGDSKDVPPVMTRYFAILQALHLTPEARQEQNKSKDDSVDVTLDTIHQDYARLLKTPDRVKAAKGQHPSANRKSTG